MAPIRFNPEKDLAPTPFDEHICRLALEMKSLGSLEDDTPRSGMGKRRRSNMMPLVEANSWNIGA
jgi:hypothetical protein